MNENHVNPLTLMSDQDRISPYKIDTKSRGQLGDYKSIQFPILLRNTKRVAWQTVAWISNEILGVKGL